MADKKECFVCGSLISEHNIIALNKKMFGRKINKFFCIDCMAEQFGVSVEEMRDKIEDFKGQGCQLFI